MSQRLKSPTEDIVLGPLSKGDLVAGKYVVESALGLGAFAWVYLAVHREIRTMRFALKVLRDEHAHDPDVRGRFRREAEMAAALSSPYVVRTNDYGELDDGTPFLVMEYIVGETLAERIARQGTIPEREVARLGQHICHALREAHDNGIVHRDLKPSNIYLVDQPSSGDFIAKVLDFGIAKLLTGLTPQEITDFETRSLSIHCTPRYAAPELLQGIACPQSDLYALGVTMIEALTGRAPYENTNAYATAAEHLRRDPVPLGRANESQLSGIIARSVAKSLDDRYSTAGEMLGAIERLFDDDGWPRSVRETTDDFDPAPGIDLRADTGERLEAARVGELLDIASIRGTTLPYGTPSAGQATAEETAELPLQRPPTADSATGMFAARRRPHPRVGVALGLLLALAVAVPLVWSSGGDPEQTPGALAPAGPEQTPGALGHAAVLDANSELERVLDSGAAGGPQPEVLPEGRPAEVAGATARAAGALHIAREVATSRAAEADAMPQPPARRQSSRVREREDERDAAAPERVETPSEERNIFQQNVMGGDRGDR